VYVEETNAECVTDTISWYPTKTKLPTATSQEIIVEALSDIHHELCNQRPDNSIVTIGPEQTNVLKKLAKTFTTLVDPNNWYMALSDDDDNTGDDIDDPPVGIQTPISVVSQRVEKIPQAIPPQRVETTADVPITDAIADQNDESVPIMEDDSDLATLTKAITNIPRVHIKHGHNTQFNSRQAASNYTLKHYEPTAYYGNAINTETKRPAEYLELSKSKQGNLWKAEM
jgi:hypothetical protein